MKLDLILTLVAGLVGLPAVTAVLIDILKWVGVIKDGDSARWSAAFNLVTLVAVAVIVNFFPNFNIPNTDAMLVEVAKFAGMVLVFVFQIWESKGVHALTVKAIPAASFSVSKSRKYVK